MRTKRWCIAAGMSVVICGMILLGPGCGGSNPFNPGSSFPFSQSSIETAVTNFARGSTGGASHATSLPSVAQSQANSSAQPPSLALAADRLLASYQLYEPISWKTTCAAGGYHEVVGHISGTFNDNGNSYLSLSANQNIHGYKCIQSGWTTEGDPYISNSGTFTIFSTHQSMSFTQGGGWTSTSDSSGKSVSCIHNISITWDNLTGGRAQGSVTCGQPTTTFTISLTF